jgi:hypothetical protein
MKLFFAINSKKKGSAKKQGKIFNSNNVHKVLHGIQSKDEVILRKNDRNPRN